MTQKEVEEQIVTAFKDVPYPGDNSIVSDHCGECEEIRETFQGQDWKKWKENPLGIIGRNEVCFTLFTPKAFHYYLPLALFACMIQYKQTDMLADFTLGRLINPLEGPRSSARHIYEALKDDSEKVTRKLQWREKDKEEFLQDYDESLHPSAESVERYYERVNLLTTDQIRAIKAYLVFMKAAHPEDDVGDIDIALKSLTDLESKNSR